MEIAEDELALRSTMTSRDDRDKISEENSLGTLLQMVV